LENRFRTLKTYADRHGMEVNVLGLLWHQGESDRTTGPAAAYQTNMTALIAKVREFTGRWDLPVIMGTVPTTSSSYSATVLAAQNAIAAADAYVWLYDFDAEGAAYIDGVHFNAATQIEFGEWAAATLLAAL
jgi:lysophospholipase L1-like esterase